MFNPGDVVVLNFPGAMGVKRRPGDVVSSALYHANRPDIIVGVITSQTAGAISPTDYLLQDWAAANLRAPSPFRSYLATVTPTPNMVIIGQLTQRDWDGVRASLKAALTELV